MKRYRLIGLILPCVLLPACVAGTETATIQSGASEQSAAVVVDLRLRNDTGEPYRPVDYVTVPENHEIGDGMFPYEGIGWENGLVGYRLYLDGRLVNDIFGKQQPEPALANIGEIGSYHELAPWGMDVLKVGPSLGIGGLGIVRDGIPMQFGEVPLLSARISESGTSTGRFSILAEGIAVPGGHTGGFNAAYSIGAESPMTRVSVASHGNIPLTTGIVFHDGAEFWQSRESSGSEWRYIATYGEQSENDDNLGMALFYRADQAEYGGLANETHYITFDEANFEFGFLAAWDLDRSGVTDKDSFDALLQSELARVEQISR